MTFFILGSYPELSIAEIEAVTGSTGRRFGDVFLMDDVGQSLPNLQNRLAGTVKIGSIVGSMTKWNKEDASNLIYSMIAPTPSDSPSGRGRVEFGISVYDHNLRQHAEPLGLEIKKKLKEDGISCRLVTSRDAALSSVVVEKNHLLTSGGEFVLIGTKEEILIGQTESVQDFESWSKRDFGRPARDAKSGMLPPKLARLMINLSGVDPAKATLLDPFCGSGTIPMEAALLGFQEVVGADIAEKAVKDSIKNLRWLSENGYTLAHQPQFLLSSAADLRLDMHVDVVATEPFLGPPQSGRETKAQLETLRVDLHDLYLKSFKNIHALMKPGAKLVVAFPIFRTGPVITKPLPGFALQKRFVYEREGAKVAREILVLVRR